MQLMLIFYITVNFYKLENFLLIIDSVDSKNLRQYTQWFQIHPDLTFEENNYRIFNKKKPDHGVKIFIILQRKRN